MVALSAADGSVPSLMAFRNAGGVIRFSPSASASGAKMLSLAPTGVPGVLGLDVGDQLVVAGQAGGLEALPLRVEVAGVGRVELLQVRGDRVGDLLDVGRASTSGAGCRPPATPTSWPTLITMRARVRVGRQRLGRPRVVADAVLDEQPRRRRSIRPSAGVGS